MSMALATIVTAFACPGCSAPLEPQGQGATLCPGCGWKGEVYLFQPVQAVFERPEEALPEDATCVHHPSKRAVAVCTGSGDYICSLCSIELEGQTFSAQFLSTHGKQKIDKAFARYLHRPDSEVGLMIALAFVIPYFTALAPVWIPFGIYRLVKAVRLRRTDELYGKIVGPGRIAALAILLALFGVLWVGFVVVIVAVVTGWMN